LPSHSWSWIWKLQLPEKYKFFFWLACHNDIPTLSLLNHKNITPSATCSRCGVQDETFIHCVRDCTFSVRLWHQLGFTNADFFSSIDAHDWLRRGAKGSQAIIFSVGVWWSWRHRNVMCIGGETWSLHRLSSSIKNSMENNLVGFPPSATAATTNRYTRWNNNNNNISGAILNVDGSCHGTPTRTGFGGVLRSDSGLFIAGFSGFIPDTDDILLAKLSAIYHGIIMAKDLGYAEFACYSDSLVCINLINGLIERYHMYVVLIQDIKYLLHQINVTVSHTLREGNQCADFMAKLGVFSDFNLLLHELPLVILLIFSEAMLMALCSSGSS